MSRGAPKNLLEIQLFIKHCISSISKICLHRRLVIDVICRSIEWRDGPFKCVQKSTTILHTRWLREIVNMLLLSCYWLWAIVKLIKSTDFSCNFKAVLDFTHAHLHKCVHFFPCASRFFSLHAHCAYNNLVTNFKMNRNSKKFAHFNKLSRNQTTDCVSCILLFV